MDKPSWFAHKKWEFFASEMIKIGDNFLFWLSSRAVLYFKDQVSPTCTEVDLRVCFHLGVSNGVEHDPFPDRDRTGFRNSEPDRTGFRKKL